MKQQSASEVLSAEEEQVLQDCKLQPVNVIAYSRLVDLDVDLSSSDDEGLYGPSRRFVHEWYYRADDEIDEFAELAVRVVVGSIDATKRTQMRLNASARVARKCRGSAHCGPTPDNRRFFRDCALEPATGHD